MEAAKRVDQIGGAGDAFPDRPKVHIVDAAKLERKLRADAAFADAHWVVSRAIARGERDASHPNPADSAALQNILDVLLGVQQGEPS